MKLYRIHTAQHKENECGIACIHMILKWHNFHINYSKLLEILKPSKEGISIQKIYDFFKSLNVNMSFCEIPENKIEFYSHSYKSKEFPCMVLLDNLDGLHYIVIYRIKRNKYIYSDPSKKIFTISTNAYFLRNAKYFICFDFKNFDKNNILAINNNFLIKEMHKSKNKIFKISFLNVILSILNVILSFELGYFIDLLSIKSKVDFLFSATYLLIFFMFFVFLYIIINYVSRQLVISIKKYIENNLGNSIFDCVLKQPNNNISHEYAGDIISRIESYLNISSSLIDNGFTFFSDAIILITCFSWMFYINYILLVIVVLSIIFNIIVVYNYLYKIYINNFIAMDTYSNYNGKLVEIINSYESIKSLSSENYFLGLLNKSFVNHKEKNAKLQKCLNAIASYRTFILIVNELIVVFIGVIFVKNNIISIGNLATFGMMVSMLQNIINRFIDFYLLCESYSVSKERLFQIIDNNYYKEKLDYKRLNRIESITFENYGIYYNDKYIINKSNFIFDKKNIILYGESGSGKSSFVKTLALLEKNYSGLIKVNNIDINNYSEEDIRKKIIYLSNDSAVFDGKLLNNFCLDKIILTERLIKICKDFDIWEYIKNLNSEFHYNVMVNSSNMSTGQRQRIALVRAILLEPEVLILDEALSNIDGNSRNKIISNLEKYNFMKIFITHESLSIPNSSVYRIKNNIIMKIGELNE